MPSLLHIRSSPPGDSVSAATVGRFLEAWRNMRPGRTVETLDLWQVELPELDRAALSARRAVEDGRAPSTGEEQVAWYRILTLADRLLAAERLVISSPMWNFGAPYRLKQFIDCVTQPTVTYRGSPETGFEGLVPGTPAALFLARGGTYAGSPERAAFDFQQRYLQTWLRFLGYSPVDTILIEPTSGDPARVREALKKAECLTMQLAERF